jgi:hypothetical protein
MSIALNIGFYVFGIKDPYTPLRRRILISTETERLVQDRLYRLLDVGGFVVKGNDN